MMPSEAEIRDFTACITELVQLWSCISIQALDTVPLLRILPNPSLQRLLQVVEKRDAFVRAQIQRHQESLEPERPRDVVDHLLLAMGDLGPKRLHMALVDLFIGGTETTAALLAWACAFLVRHPEVQDRIHAELQDVLGPTAPLRPRDRDRLPLLSATLNETLRLRPPVPLALPHRTTRPTSVAGMSIPQDTIVIPNLFAAHHDETKWLEPEEFRPERFLAPGALRDLLPFSCGARACPGEALARAEALVTLGRLLREFRLEPAVLGTLPALNVVSFGIVLRCPSLCLRLVPRPRAPPPARGHTLVTPLPGVMTPLPGELP
ncbi:steroid 21-hydroxylase precursor [Alligator mississippiensis]|uniref:Steroid 21-hydroxylase n=1 Tax=Alligator mississippiensis TaxID=8496 RepID=A0A151M676_ALLMI|nr:steroid 21-hydroxylase precursor [Alligator mississippiensis]